MKRKLGFMLVSLLILLVLDHGWAAEQNEAPRLNLVDLPTSASVRLIGIADPVLRAEVLSVADRVRGALTFDAEGNAIIKGEPEKIEVLNNSIVGLEFKIKAQKPDHEIMVSKHHDTGLDTRIGPGEGKRINIGLTRGEPFAIVRQIDDENGRVLLWDKKTKKLTEQYVKKEHGKTMPKLAQTTIWPELPEKIVFNQPCDEKIVARLQDEYELARLYVDLVKMMQAEATYGEFSRVYYGTLPGWGDVEKIIFRVTQMSNCARTVAVTHKNGDRLMFQFDPIAKDRFYINVYDKNNKLTQKLLCDWQGVVISYQRGEEEYYDEVARVKESSRKEK